MRRDAVVVGVWMGWIAFVSVATGPSFQQLEFKMWGVVAFDAFTHFVSYACLAYLTAIWWARQRRFVWLRRHAMVTAVLFSALYGVVMEVIQMSIPGRYYAASDVMANLLGALTGGLVFRLIAGNVYRF